MDFLKELFGGQALTFEQLAEATKNKGFQVVNAAGGAYVPKADADNLNGQITTLTTQLGEANKKLEGYDPAWKESAAAEQKKLDAQRNEFLLDKALSSAKAKDTVAVKAHLDREKLTFAGGEVIGLDKQLADLRKGETTAFLFEQEAPVKTGISHQGGSEGAPDKKEEANAALRALFGKEN
ncbi:phage scaffolding protein [Agathobaculum sp. NTUH-O15-33]|uniref:phage scaffolding protein n=1 Tax=Agathobaculum sp. NTUH-O15-33 TaxID=3079302 RepID=UPI0029584BA8|nr:phage scaffolding protein [Agathobaculum sp. NTUH-O15-33]WNX84372.1 phage scaffolding protein [Agathobaculum sp. NTUH-O15-33]